MTTLPSAAETNVALWLERNARERGSSPALQDDWRALDHATLADRVARCANWLHTRGLRRRGRVALLLDNRSAAVECVFAAARLGAIAVPLNARLTAPEVAALLRDSEPSCFVSDTAHQGCATESLAAAALRCETLVCGGDPDAYEAMLRATPPGGPAASVSPEDPMLLMYTSGTTGRPKGALLPQRKTLYNALNARILFGTRADDRVLVALPLFHSFGLKILTLPALHAGASVRLHARFDAQRFWRALRDEGIAYAGGVPTQLRALLEALADDPALWTGSSRLRFLFGAGAALPIETIQSFAGLGIRLRQGYGQTETSLLCCLEAEDALAHAGSVGRPGPNLELRVIRPRSLGPDPAQWESADPGETGEIVVRGPIAMTGYWRQPDATRETLIGDWLRTGDLATRDAEGFVRLVGRLRELYISGGENVYPAEIEAAYAAHPGLQEIAVLGLPDPVWGEVGHACCVPVPGAPFDPEALRAWGAERLASFKLPRAFHAFESLPRTETGKVQKHRLREALLAASPLQQAAGRDETRPLGKAPRG